MHRSIGRIAAISLLGVLFAACAGMNKRVEAPRPTTPPPADKARIVFVMPQGWPGGLTTILHEDKVVCHIENKQYCVYEMPAGEAFFMSVSSNAEGMRGQFQGGKTYYIKTYITPGFLTTMIFWAPLEPGTEDWNARFEWLDGGTYVELNPEKAAEWEEEYAERNAERITKLKSGDGKVQEVRPELCE